MKKTCCNCELEFESKSKDSRKRRGLCSKCKSAYNKKWYKENKEEQASRVQGNNKDYREEFRRLLDKLKDKPCMDCGHKFHPCAMDFDHRDPSIKDGNVSKMISYRNTERLLKEIEKCDLVCANCHRLRTHNRNHGPLAQLDRVGLS